ncbi:hypothetical protein TNCV_274321 [Trichonephila clavipes]|nr:hypothetical protein TNCV_274321 [Trichonephila clavipes]
MLLYIGCDTVLSLSRTYPVSLEVSSNKIVAFGRQTGNCSYLYDLFPQNEHHISRNLEIETVRCVCWVHLKTSSYPTSFGVIYWMATENIKVMVDLQNFKVWSKLRF